MKKLIPILALLLLLTACSSGPSKSEYAKTKSELEALKQQVSQMAENDTNSKDSSQIEEDLRFVPGTVESLIYKTNMSDSRAKSIFDLASTINAPTPYNGYEEDPNNYSINLGDENQFFPIEVKFDGDKLIEVKRPTQNGWEYIIKDGELLPDFKW